MTKEEFLETLGTMCQREGAVWVVINHSPIRRHPERGPAVECPIQFVARTSLGEDYSGPIHHQAGQAIGLNESDTKLLGAAADNAAEHTRDLRNALVQAMGGWVRPERAVTYADHETGVVLN